MRQRIRETVILLVLLGIASAASAKTLEVQNVDSSAFPLITVRTILSSPDGQRICGPIPGTFTVQEDGTPAGDVAAEWIGEPSARRVVLVLAASRVAKNQGNWPCIQHAALDAVDHLSTGDEVALVVYRNCPELVMSWTTDLAAVREEIEGITPTGRSPMTDGIYLGMETVCDAGGGTVLYIGDGIELDSYSCDYPPDGLEGDGLIDDATSIKDLAQSCGATFSVIHTQWQNVTWLSDLSSELNGAYEICGDVSEGSWGGLLGSASGSSNCYVDVTYTSPNLVADGTLRSVEVCFNDQSGSACATASYTATCQPSLKLDPRTEGVFSVCQDASASVALIVQTAACANPDVIEAHITKTTGDNLNLAMSPLDAEGHYGADVPADWETPGNSVSVSFVATFGADQFQLPADGGAYELSYCPGDTSGLTVSLPSVNSRPGEDVLVPMMLSGWQGDFITSYEVTITLSRPDLTLLGVSDEGSLPRDSGWMSPAYSSVSPTEIRIASAGAQSLQGSGNLATLSFHVPDEAVGGCVDLSLTSVVLNDGFPQPIVSNGEVCIDASCVAGRVISWATGNPGIAGVSVINSDNGAELAKTDSSGAYELCLETTTNIAFTGGPEDDTAISAMDAALILRSAVGLEDFSQPSMVGDCGEYHPREMAGDVSGDGSVGSFDASLILQKLVGEITELPDHGWRFVCSPISVTPGSSIPDVTGVLMGDVNLLATGTRSAKKAAVEAVRWERTDQEGRHWVLRTSGSTEASSCELSLRVPERDATWSVPDSWLYAARARTGRLDMAMAIARAVGPDAPLLYVDTPMPWHPVESTIKVVIDDHPASVTVQGPSIATTSSASFRVISAAAGIQFEWQGWNSEAPVLDIYDVRGRKVAHQTLGSGSGSMKWSEVDHSSKSFAHGIYFARIHSQSGKSIVRKIAVINN